METMSEYTKHTQLVPYQVHMLSGDLCDGLAVYNCLDLGLEVELGQIPSFENGQQLHHRHHIIQYYDFLDQETWVPAFTDDPVQVLDFPHHHIDESAIILRGELVKGRSAFEFFLVFGQILIHQFF